MKSMKSFSPVITGSLIAISVLFLTGCDLSFGGVKGEGEIREEVRSLPSFDSIDFSGKGQIALITGDKYGIRVETYENLLPLLITEVKNNRLKVKFEKSVRSDKPIRFYITAPEYRELSFSGGVSVKSAGPLVSKKIELDFSGASEGILEIQSDILETSISGAGEMTFSGVAENHKIVVSGAAEIKAFDLRTKKTQMTISGAGDAEIHAEEELIVKISGAGDVVYKGDPVVEKKISGAGSIKKY